MRVRALMTAAAAAAALLAAGCGSSTPAAPPPESAVTPAPAAPGAATTLDLPTGFAPEGVAVDAGGTAYFGSRTDGSLYRASVATGQGQVFSPGPGTPSLGLETDRAGRLWVAGGSGGNARVVDAASGAVLASYPLATGPSFVNDVVLAGGSAWFTDSTNPVLYRIPLGPDGAPPPPAAVTRVPLSGALVYGPGINANGIESTPDGSALLVVQSTTGRLFRVDPATGATTPVDLGGAVLTNGDGLTRDGATLFAVENRSNAVAVVDLAPDGASGRVARTITHPLLDVPTTVAVVGDRLLLPNARYSTPSTPQTPYAAVLLPRG